MRPLILDTAGSIDFSGEDWARLGLILLASLLYIGFFLMLGLLVSSRSKRSATSLMTLLFIWVLTVLAAPKVSMIIADKLSYVPSVRSVQAEKGAMIAQSMAEYQKKTMQSVVEFQAKAPQYVQDGTADMRSQERQVKLNRMTEDMYVMMSRKAEKIQTEYDRKKAAQFRLAANISRISPASVYAYAATGLARTGFHRQEEFLTAARSYHMALERHYYAAARKFRIKGANAEVDMDELLTPELKESNLSESWELVWGDLLILFLLVACFFMIAYVGFVRSDIR